MRVDGVDLDAREVVVSVRDLVDRPPDTPRPRGWLSFARAEIGTDVHRAVRAEREGTAGYAPEVPVVLVHEVDGFSVRLTGRVDGLCTGDGALVVEEVKSATLLEATPAWLLQVRLYALMLARTRPGTAVAARLLLVSVLDGARRTIEVPCDHARTARHLDELVRARIAAARHARVRAAGRAAAADALRFPYAAPRAHQEELLEAVARGLAAGRPVLATAPTGVGKTVSALLPALRHALAHDAVLFFATAKTTQQALVARTFRDLLAAAGPAAAGLRALTLRAKRAMCPPGTLLCHPDHCFHLERFLDRPRREATLADLRAAGAHLAPPAIDAAGRAARICPHALSLALCNEADLIVGDYNYVYGPSSALGLGRSAVVVVDEAHNLFDRARGYDSPFLARAAVADVAWRAPLLFPEAEEFLLGLEATLRALAAGAGDGRPVGRDAVPWAVLAKRAVRLGVRYAHAREADDRMVADDPFLAVFRRIVRLRDLVAADERELLPYANAEGAGVLCLNPAARLARRHRAMAGTVAMSATLHPLPYYRDVLGFAGMAPLEVECPSPFPASRRRVVVVPTVRTTYRRRHAEVDGIAAAVAQVSRVRPGHYAAYFPSFSFLDAVRARLPATPGPVLAQRPGLDAAGRADLLARLRGDPGPLLLLAVLGGVLAEGIDLPGDALHGAIVVGPGLPPVGFERAAMQRYFEETAGRGFSYAMVYPGLQRVIQAAGRVHRTPGDTGVIVLLGRRFAQRPYRDVFPAHWSPVVAADPAPVLDAFWRGAGARGACVQ